MRVLNRLRPARTAAVGEPPAGGRIRLFRLTHVVVVLTNVLQLLFMITFLVLLLMQLNRSIAVSWCAVFAPLWTSDAITTITGIQEMRRLCAPGESRRSALASASCASRPLTGLSGWVGAAWTPAHPCSAPHRSPTPLCVPACAVALLLPPLAADLSS